MKLAALLAVLAALAVVPPAMARQVSFAGLEAACLAHADEFGHDELQAPGVLPKFCGCLVTRFPGLSQFEVDALTRELQGTLSREERMAIPNQEAIGRAAESAVDYCMSPAALSVGSGESAPAGPAAPGSLNFMEPVASACIASEQLLAMLQGSATGAFAARVELCGCLVTRLKGRIDKPGAELVARELRGTLSSAERDAAADLGRIVEGTFDECQDATGNFTAD